MFKGLEHKFRTFELVFKAFEHTFRDCERKKNILAEKMITNRNDKSK